MNYHDHHFHPMGYVSMVTGLELMDTEDFDDLFRRVSEVRDASDKGAIIGQRLNDEGLTEHRFPDRHFLDEISHDRPILLYRYCGHIGVANSAALALAGVETSTADPDGGRFDRDSTGSPNGVLRETALGVVSDALSPISPIPSRDETLAALTGLTEVGIGSVTGMVSAGEPMWCGVGRELDAILDLAPDLPIDIGLIVITEDPAELAGAAAAIRSTEGRVSFVGWKDFSDGSLGGHTAAMYEPFADEPDEIGTLRLRPEKAAMMARTSLALGGAVAIHAIGDRANDEVLDLFEVLLGEGAHPASLRLEHASLVTDKALARMQRMGITVSVQPAFLASEGDWLEKRLGAARMRLAYRFRSMVEAGLTVLGGSDCPVEPPDPAIGIAAATNRHGINTDEELTASQSEALFTPPGIRGIT
ncbi:MAG TPA: amidohydrolase family protein [Acidimicrobiia bacterium]